MNSHTRAVYWIRKTNSESEVVYVLLFKLATKIQELMNEGLSQQEAAQKLGVKYKVAATEAIIESSHGL
jgi:hypothetical protein